VTQVPPELVKLSRLQRLTLNDNQMAALPTEFNAFTRLQVFFITLKPRLE